MDAEHLEWNRLLKSQTVKVTWLSRRTERLALMSQLHADWTNSTFQHASGYRMQQYQQSVSESEKRETERLT